LVKRLPPDWYTVRCVFHWTLQHCYEERITVWRAASIEDAIAKAEREGERYAHDNPSAGIVRLDIAQAYHMYDRPKDGAEVYSLLRDSNLEPEEYIERHFTTGGERQREV
jgi:hypothetical protein